MYGGRDESYEFQEDSDDRAVMSEDGMVGEEYEGDVVAQEASVEYLTEEVKKGGNVDLTDEERELKEYEEEKCQDYCTGRKYNGNNGGGWYD